MNARTITVFVSRQRGVHRAATFSAEAIHSDSSTLAARRCAAEHFGVNEHEIELTPNGEHTMIANVRAPGIGGPTLVVAALASLCFGLVALTWLFWGGAR